MDHYCQHFQIARIAYVEDYIDRTLNDSIPTIAFHHLSIKHSTKEGLMKEDG
jgi:hypothetical protein